MWYRDAALVEDRISRLDREAREAALVALARAHQPARPGRVRTLTAAAVRGFGRRALAAATWIDARTTEQESSSLNEMSWHRS